MVTVTRFRANEAPQTFPDLAASDWNSDSRDTLWIDLEEPTDEELRLLEDPFRFHPLAIEDCLTPEHQPKIEDFGPYLFLIFRGIDPSAPETTFETIKLAAFLGPNFLVTYHRRPMRSVNTVKAKYARGAGPVNLRGSDYLLYEILDHLIEHYFPVLERLEDQMDMIEHDLFSKCGPQTLDRILTTKRQVAEIKRTLAPHRDVLGRIGRGEYEEIDAPEAVFYRDLYDSTVRLTETADAYRDLLSGLFDAYLSIISNRINEVMRVLTIFASIMLPLTFIVGVYGMNFDYMPELRWRYGYFAVLGLMTAVTAGLLLFFRRKGWL
ncbi:MAG: magnesium/cobalt transporter CorA [Gemmatimonadota bacterium]